MKLRLSRLIPSGALLCLVLASCKKNEAVTSKPISPTSSPLIRTTNMIVAMDNESDLEMSDVISGDTPSDCPIVTYNPSKDVYPHTKTVDYGTGCTGSDGVTRSGKRFATIYADENTAPAGKVISVTTFSNYYASGVNIAGTIKISIGNPANPGPLVLKYVVNKTVTDTLGNTSSYVNTATQKLISGGGNNSPADDVFQISQNTYGTEVSGDSAMITWKSESDPANPVIKANSCQFRSQGALKITLKQLGVITNEYLDYGNGDCDNKATLSVNNGTPQQVTLPLYFFGADL